MATRPRILAAMIVALPEEADTATDARDAAGDCAAVVGLGPGAE